MNTTALLRRSLVAGSLIAVVCGATAFVYMRQSVVNVMHPALDRLSKVPLSERWSHPEMNRIRKLGPEAVDPLRRVLREKDSASVRCLLWLKSRWPGSTNIFPSMPNAQQLAERRWTACQALRMLGPAGRPAAKELVDILYNGDVEDLNSTTMALQAVGMSEREYARIVSGLETGTITNHSYSAVLRLLSIRKPPSDAAQRVLISALSHSSPWVQDSAARTLQVCGVKTPEAVSALKQLQSSTTNALALIAASAALWDVEKNSAALLPKIIQMLEPMLDASTFPPPLGGGHGGQALSQNEKVFMDAASLFARMNLQGNERENALAMMTVACEVSGRIFVKMLLLPSMVKLGASEGYAVKVCREGLNYEESYYRLQAARLIAHLSETSKLEHFALDRYLSDRFVGVRVYAAQALWNLNREPRALVPVLVEALNQEKHQSYYYPEIQTTALKLLAQIGPQASEATSVLERLRKDLNPDVADLADKALSRIRPIHEVEPAHAE